MTSGREHRPIMLDIQPPAEPEEVCPEPSQEDVHRCMQQLLMQHIVPAGAMLARTPFMRHAEPGHSMMLVKERRIVSLVSRWSQQPRQRDWGKIRFQDDRQEIHEWIIDHRGRGLDARLLMLPVMRVHEFLSALDRQARDMARQEGAAAFTRRRRLDDEILRQFREAVGEPVRPEDAQSGGITRENLEEALAAVSNYQDPSRAE